MSLSSRVMSGPHPPTTRCRAQNCVDYLRQPLTTPGCYNLTAVLESAAILGRPDYLANLFRLRLTRFDKLAMDITIVRNPSLPVPPEIQAF